MITPEEKLRWNNYVDFQRELALRLYGPLKADLEAFGSQQAANDGVYPLHMGQFLLTPNTDLVPLPRVKYIIIHATGSLSGERALSLMMNPTQPGTPSAHVLIATTGQTIWMVPPEFIAFHAGRSGWAGEDELNPISLGIELQNPGEQGGYPAYTVQQMTALKMVLRYFLNRYGLEPSAVLGHSDVSPNRADKTDPYYNFPWKELEAEGLAAPWVPHRPNRKVTLWEAILARGYRYGPGRLEKGIPVGHSLRRTKNSLERDEVTPQHILEAVQRRFGLAVTGSFDEPTVRFLRAA